MTMNRTVHIAQTARERDLIREINDQQKEIEFLHDQLGRARARIKWLEDSTKDKLQRHPIRTDLTPAPQLKGETLKPGAIGYITWVQITAQGKRILNAANNVANPVLVGITLADQLILAITNLSPNKINFDKITQNIPKEIAPHSKVISYTALLDSRGLLEVTYEHIMPTMEG